LNRDYRPIDDVEAANWASEDLLSTIEDGQPRWASSADSLADQDDQYDQADQYVTGYETLDEELEGLLAENERLALAQRNRYPTTITEKERQTFVGIFKSILTEGKEKQSEGEELHTLMGDALFEEGAIRKARGRGGDMSFDPTAPRAPKIGGARPVSHTQSAEDLEQQRIAALPQYPPSIRPLAKEATLAISAMKRKAKREAERIQATAESEAMRNSELTRIEGLLRAAPTDLKLWDVVEKEVLGMVGQLERDVLSEAGLGSGESKAKRGRGRPAKKPKAPDAGMDADATPEADLSSLSVIGPNYPHLLLLSARLFLHNFASPQLALHLINTIRHSSPLSYVLGATPSLYNEALLIHFRHYRDYSAIWALLEEMDSKGVQMDEATQRVVEVLRLEREIVRRGARGGVLRALGGGERERTAEGRGRWWAERVGARLEERRIAAEWDVELGEEEEEAVSR
jgi:Mtf2 family